MTSLFSAGQSISSIGKSMTAIARVEEHLATFMKKVIYFDKFFQRMGPNLPICVMDTASLLFQRCYEYRDEIRDELESSVAYVADAGRWVVGIGDWNSKMEKRLNQVSELVLLANTLLTEYAVTGKVGAGGCRDELVAYLQILAATITLKNPPMNRKDGGTITNLDERPPIARSQSGTAAEFSSEISALGTEISGAFSEMFGNNDWNKSTSSGTIGQTSRPSFDTDDDAMNPFAVSYRHPVDPYVKVVSSAGASVTSSLQSLPDATLTGAGAASENPQKDEDFLDGPLNLVSMGEYECLEIDSIPKYAAFKSSAQLAARRQYASCSGNGSLATSLTSDGGRIGHSELRAEYNEFFPLPPSSTHTNFNCLSSLDRHTVLKKKYPVEPIRDLNYSYDFQCEVAHNPFISSNTLGLNEDDVSVTSQQKLPSLKQQPARSTDGRSKMTRASSPPSTSTTTTSAVSAALGQTHTPVSLSFDVIDPSAAETEAGAVPLPPTVDEAIGYTQVQAHAAVRNGPVTSAQSSSLNAVQGHSAPKVDATEARALTADHEHHDSDHEYNLFGVG
ncbi:unnamed protein product [Peronospora farinosa]|uniref:Uncharacterized protein n=1 Tax=Peronospora farinosa TaxID=134698 RepID=A0AAV0TJQ7_9STRA|nr:unnamed protein product [Peronospora farinosa]CAI5721863.1 unnamed protein product [Peronospora farinosa]